MVIFLHLGSVWEKVWNPTPDRVWNVHMEMARKRPFWDGFNWMEGKGGQTAQQVEKSVSDQQPAQYPVH